MTLYVARGRPAAQDGPATTTAPPLTVPDPVEVARLIELSDERSGWLRRVLVAEIRGYDRGVTSMASEYDRGFADGVLAHKRAQHDLHRSLQAELIRWDGWREDFGRPRPGDYTGGPVSWECQKAGAA